jgi:AraC-like DNA-binding protein
VDAFRCEWRPRDELAALVDRVWADRSARADPLLPDGAVELVWSGHGLFVRGADTHAHAVGAFPDRTFVGLRFRVGAAPVVLGVEGSELVDARPGISSLWGRAEMERLEGELAEADSPRAAAAVLEDAVAARATRAPDPAVAALVATLRRQRDVKVRALADRLGLSERQLLRRCSSALGYGPKTVHRILRFQRFLTLAAERRTTGLVELAAAAGYADQPHLTRECTSLASSTPADLRVRFLQDKPVNGLLPSNA